MDCLFCKIIAGDIPSSKVYEDENCFAFRDIHPQAQTHIVIVPKIHVTDLSDAADKLPAETLAAMLRAAAKIAAREGLAPDGYRIVSNCGKNACQSVPHWHIHLLGGQQLADKMA